MWPGDTGREMAQARRTIQILGRLVRQIAGVKKDCIPLVGLS